MYRLCIALGLALVWVVRPAANRPAEALIKLALSAKETWHQKVEHGPQFQHTVLYWSPRQNQSVSGNETLDSSRDLCLAIADCVPLVQYTVVEAAFSEELDVGPNGLIRHDYNIRIIQ